MVAEMKIKKILRIAFFSGLAAVLLSFTAQAECAEYGELSAPGGLVEDVSEFIRALGGG